MKIKLLFLGLLISVYGFTQTWTQVGGAQFTNLASDAAMTFDAGNGDVYVAYSNVADGNKAYVSKFDGTNWTSIGLVSNDVADNLAIKINPFNNEIVVAYRSVTNNMTAYKYNGTAWSSIFTNVGSSALSDHRLQIQFNAAGTIRVAGREWTQKLFIVERNTAGTGSNYLEVLIQTNNQYNGDHRYDFTAYGEYFVSQENNYNGGVIGRKNVGSANNNFDFNHFINGSTPKNISGIYDSNYHAFYNDIIPQGAANNDIRVFNGSSFIKSVTATNDIVELRKSTNDDKLYLMYANNTDDIVFENYDTSLNTWATLPSIGLNYNSSNFFIKMAVSEADGNLYALYQDGGKISIQKYTIVAPLNLPLMYVDADATGTGDGSSWTNAYTSLTDCLDNLGTSTTEIWIADGTYTPTGSGVSSTYLITKSNFKIYGGFDGTELQLSDRDVIANAPTIFEGDVNGNDTSLDPYNSSRSDNIQRLVHMDADDLEIDGITFQNANADNSGSAIYSDSQIGLAIKNCKFLNNGAKATGVIYHRVNATINAGSTYFTVENCEFHNNTSRYWGTTISLETNSYATLNVSLVNNVFTNNTNNSTFTDTNSGTSTIYFGVEQSNSSISGDIVNCTFTNNTNFVSTGNAKSSVIALEQDQGTNTVNISNCIIYGNQLTDNSVTTSIDKMYQNSAAQTVVINSIGEDNFTNLTFVSNSSNANPLFLSSSNFRLTTSSPAKDTGDNSKIPAGITTDLDGNQRIFNTTVDMGAYEYDPTLSNDSFQTNNEFVIYPNPVENILNIKATSNINKVDIYTIQGVKILESNLGNINVSTLSSGLYIISVQDENDIITSKKFIKK